MAEHEEQNDPNYNPESDEVEGDFALVTLPEVPTITGEEDEELIVKWRSKLYRWRNAQWKERGVGDFKMLKNKSGKIRLLLRADKTHKIVANFFIQSEHKLCILSKLQTAEKTWTWDCCDFSDQKASMDKFAAKFLNVNDYEAFKVEFEKAYENNKQLQNKSKETGTESESKKEECHQNLETVKKEDHLNLHHKPAEEEEKKSK